MMGSTDENHLERLEKVLQRLEEYGLRVKKAKCDFCQPLVEYLGHQVDANGLHTLPSKVAAIFQAPEPENEQQLRWFLGLKTRQLVHAFHPSCMSLMKLQSITLMPGGG